LEQQVDEATLVVKRIRTPAGNRRVSRVQPVTGLVLIEPDDRHASAAERTRDRKSGDVTVEHQRRPHFCRADLLAYGGDELATIIDHGLESSRGNSRGGVTVILRTCVADRNALYVQRLGADILLVRPLDSAEGDTYLPEIGEVFQFSEDLVLQIGFRVEPFRCAIRELQIKIGRASCRER